MMKECSTMYFIVEIAREKCVHADAETMCCTFAMQLSIGTKENAVINLFPKKPIRNER